MGRRLALAVACIQSALVSVHAAAAETYAWPLDQPRALTSSFAEFRNGRFHAGIDLRTGGTGKPVHAAQDGHVSRVRCSPWGYGKAVYLALEDGNTVVYAHLSDFAPDLREYVRLTQHARKTYTVDLHPTPGRFPITRGEIIAWSGDTGVGVPHLHYEIRDSANRPIKPRRLDITWRDTTRPTIRRVLIVPADPASSVNGDILPVMCAVTRTDAGSYRCEPVQASGRIGFGVDLVDPANNGESKLGVHVLRTLVDGTEVFRVQNDVLSYETIANGAVAWHPFLLEEGAFLLQWRWPGNQADCFRKSPSDGWLEVPSSGAAVLLEARDFLGNTAVVEVPIAAGPSTPPPDPAGQGGDSGTVSLDCLGTWVVVTARFPEPEPETPLLVADGPAPSRGGVFQRVDGRTFRAGYDPSAGSHEVALWVDHPRVPAEPHRIAVFHRGEGGTATLQDLTIEVDGQSPYGKLFASVREVPAEEAPSLRMLGKQYHIWPQRTPIDEPVRIRFPMPHGAERAGRVHLYRWTGSGWSWENTERRPGQLVISTRRFGTYAAMEDVEPPLVDLVQPTEGSAASRRPVIRAAVADTGSGIGDVTVSANGMWLLTEYDPEEYRIEWMRDEDLPVGRVSIALRVTDKAGNATSATRHIDVQP